MNRRTLRLQSFSGGPKSGPNQPPGFGGGPIAPFEIRSADVVVHHVEARPDWQVAVAIKEAHAPTLTWTIDNEALRAKARASLEHPPQ